MSVISLGSQIFDLAFHPTSNVVYSGLLNGKVKAFTYDDQGAHSPAWELRISKRSCRGVALSPDGSSLYAVGKNRSLQFVSTSSTRAKHKCVVRSVPLTPAPEPRPRHARVCTSECYRPAMPSMNTVYHPPQRTHQSCRASYSAPPCHWRRRWHHQGEQSRVVLSSTTVRYGAGENEAMGPAETGRCPHVYAAL
jgi:hypothetical protein